MIAVVAGSTGLVGSFLLQKLLADADIDKVISVGRKKIPNPSSKLHQVLISDLSQLKDQKNELKGDLYFCCLGTTIKDAGSQQNFEKVDFQAVCDFGWVAAQNNAKSLAVVSSAGANEKSKIFYSRTKGRAEQALKEFGLKSLIFLRPGLLLGPRKSFRFGEVAITALLKSVGQIVPAKLEKRWMTKAEDVAIRMLSESKKNRPGIHTLEATDM